MKKVFTDLSGKRFGNLVPIRYERVKNTSYWHCLCDCGREKRINYSALARGQSNCGNGHVSDPKVGNRYGRLFIIMDRPNNDPSNRWLCLCDCGKQFDCSSSFLFKGRDVKSCGCVVSATGRPRDAWTGCGEISDFEFSYLRWVAKQRLQGTKPHTAVFTVTKEYLLDLFLDQGQLCAESGLPIYFAKTDRELRAGAQSASLDRIDSNKGYVPGNVQWVHKHVNYIKLDNTRERFLEICTAIADTHPATGYNGVFNTLNSWAGL